MKLTQTQLKQLIKEELQAVLGERKKEKLDEGMLATMLGLMFAGGVENITIDGKSFDQKSFSQMLDSDGDGELDKQFPQSMDDVMAGDRESGIGDADGSYSTSDCRVGNQHIKQLVKNWKGMPSKSKEIGGTTGNALMQLVNLTNTNKSPAEIDAVLQNIDQATAKEFMAMPEFQKIVKNNRSLKNKIQQIAGGATLVR